MFCRGWRCNSGRDEGVEGGRGRDAVVGEEAVSEAAVTSALDDVGEGGGFLFILASPYLPSGDAREKI